MNASDDYPVLNRQANADAYLMKIRLDNQKSAAEIYRIKVDGGKPRLAIADLYPTTIRGKMTASCWKSLFVPAIRSTLLILPSLMINRISDYNSSNLAAFTLEPQ